MTTTSPDSFKLKVWDYIVRHARVGYDTDVWLNRVEFGRLWSELPWFDRVAGPPSEYRSFNIWNATIYFHPDAPSILEKPRPWLLYKSTKT
jgi:hypothetical protein